MKKTIAIISTTIGIVIGSIIVGKSGAQIVPTFSSIAEIQEAQEEYKNKNGKYLQVIPGNKLSKEKTGTVKDKLGKNLPTGYSITEYVSPNGPGFDIIWTDSEGEHIQGFGPEANERTKFIPTKKATST